jgi:hypothetical protein
MNQSHFSIGNERISFHDETVPTTIAIKKHLKKRTITGISRFFLKEISLCFFQIRNQNFKKIGYAVLRFIV